jgi:hypothetical protein
MAVRSLAARSSLHDRVAAETEFGKNYRVQSNNHLTYAQAAAAKAAAQKKEAAQKV